MKHPDYDIEFKPAIARYDWDQTYDVLEFVHLPQGFNGLTDSLGIPAFELMAIDRYTPYNYLWAEAYSDAVYNFLKRFNFSPYQSILQRDLTREASTTVVRDINGNRIVLPAFVYSHKYSRNASYPVQLSKGKYRITMLIEQGIQTALTGGIVTINQACYALTLTEDTEIDLNKIIKRFTDDSYAGNTNSRFCANSILISKEVNGAWQQVDITSNVDYLFYTDIDAYFGDVKQALLAYFADIIAEYNYDSISLYNTYPNQGYCSSRLLQYATNWTIANGDLDSPIAPTPYPKTQTATYNTYPDYLKDYCFLQRANNNKWGGFVYSDLGVVPTTKLNNVYGKLLGTDYESYKREITDFTDNYWYGYAVPKNSVEALFTYNIDSYYTVVDAYNLPYLGFYPYHSYFPAFIVRYDSAITHQRFISRPTPEPFVERQGVEGFQREGYTPIGMALGLRKHSITQTIYHFKLNGGTSYFYKYDLTGMQYGYYDTILGNVTGTATNLATVPSGETASGSEDVSLMLNTEPLTQGEWDTFSNYGAMSDADYLNYLLYTKAQQEAQ